MRIPHNVRAELEAAGIYILTTLFTSRYLFLQSGYFDRIHDWLIPNNAITAQNYALPAWEAYSPLYLGVSPSYLTSQWWLVFVGFMGNINLASWLPNLALGLPLFLMQYVQYLFLRNSLGFKRRYAFLGGLVYLLTPFIFYRVVAGHVYFNFGYCFFPLFLLAFQKAVASTRKSSAFVWSVVAGWAMVICGWQIQFFVFGFLFGVLWLFVTRGSILRKVWVSLLVITTNVVAALPWVLPFAAKTAGSGGGESARSALSLGFIDYQSTFTNLINLYKGRGAVVDYLGIHLQELPFPFVIAYFIGSGIIMLISFYGIYASFGRNIHLNIRRRTFVVSSLGILCGVLFLAKGFNEPFGWFNEFLYQRIVLLGLFREIYHLSFVIIFLSNIFFVWGVQHLSYYSVLRIHKRFLYACVLISVLMSGTPFYSGDWVLVKKTTISPELESTLISMEDERVMFFPSLQPFSDDPNARYGGWELAQAQYGVSTFQQGNISDSWARLQVDRLHYCIIIDTSCLSEVIPTFQRLGFNYIIVRKDIASLFYTVSPIGVYSREKNQFINADYEYILESIGIQKVSSFDDHSVFRLPPAFEDSFVYDHIEGYIGGNGATASKPYVSLSYPEELERNEATTVFAANNKARLLGILSNPKSVVHEPGYWQIDGGWLGYRKRWWLPGTNESKYNGILSFKENVTLETRINKELKGEYNVWLSLGYQEPEVQGVFSVGFPEYDFAETVVSTAELRNQGAVNIGQIDIDTSSLVVKFENITGASSIEALILEPVEGSTTFNHQNTQLEVGTFAINPDKTNNFRIPNSVEEFETGIFNPTKRNTKLEVERSQDRLILDIDYGEPNDIGEFVFFTKDFSLASLSAFENYSRYIVPYSANHPDDILIDVNITVESEDFRETIFYNRFDKLEEEGELELDLDFLNQIVRDLDVEGDVFVTRVSFLVNKKIDRTFIQDTHQLIIEDPYFSADLDQYINSADQANIYTQLNKLGYFKQIEEYQVDTTSPTWRFRPFTKRGTRGTDLAENNGSLYLKVAEDVETNEFASAQIPGFNQDVYDNQDILAIPVELDTENAFIDMVLVFEGEDEGYETRSGPIREVKLTNGRYYMIMDLRKMREVYGERTLIGAELVLNKKRNQEVPEILEFIVGDPIILDGYYNEYINSFQAGNKETGVYVWSPLEKEYEVEFVYSDRSDFRILRLEEGLNTIQVPAIDTNAKFLRLSLAAQGQEKDLNNQNISLQRIGPGHFEFYLPEQTQHSIFMYQYMYDPDWILEVNGREIQAQRYNFLFNGFELQEGDVGKATLRYRIQPIKSNAIRITIIMGIIQVLISIIVVLISAYSRIKRLIYSQRSHTYR